MNAPERLDVLSAQEAALVLGKRAVHDNVSDRVLRLFERARNSGQPRVALERAVLFTESFKATEGQPIALRWAKALAEGKPDAVVITEEDAKVIREVTAPYWTGRDFTPNFIKALPEEARNFSWGPDKSNLFRQTVVIMSSQSMRSSQNWVIDHGKLMRLGCKGIRDDARARLAALTNPHERTTRAPFLEAVIVTCDAMSTRARRYAEKARELAAAETDALRKTELLEIAEVCAWAPENPCRTFREALQVQWFSQCMSRLEEMIGGDVNQGRIDQYPYPYYKADLEAGRLTDEAATELFQCLWVNMMQHIQLNLSPTAAAGREGDDATNALSYLLLESTRALRTSYPELAARIHANTPERFLHAVAEANKDGKGSPKVVNDEYVVPFHLPHGVPIADALDYAVSGCIESRLPNIETHKTGNSAIN